MSINKDDFISVSELNLMIKDNIKKSFHNKISVKGELSGYKKYGNSIYANLKDDTSIINIVKFKCTPQDNFKSGDLVLTNGYIDYYLKNGAINFICNNIENCGIGNILQQLENLKQKYQNLGYFNNKKSFPDNIKSIGIITAKDGAALQDILFVLNSNKFNGNIYVKNSPVQGTDCAKGVCAGIEHFNMFRDKSDRQVDLIMITRGGGGIDDLMGFSDPKVIEKIYESKIFTMSAVGHEIDNMLSDYVADIRAPTPSIGAEIICKNCINKYDKIKDYKDKLSYSRQIIINRINTIKKNFFVIKKKMYVDIYDKNIKKIDKLDNIFIDLIKNKFNTIKNNIDKTKSNIEIMKHNEYNALLMRNNKLITDIDSIDNGLYDIKINGKIRKINIKLV
jgi:exodeoxyribonuclease VII large subunit